MDNNDGLWVTTLDQGIYYYPNLEIKVYNEKQGLPSSKNISLISLDSQFLITGYETNDICILGITPQDSLRIKEHFVMQFQPGTFFFHEPDSIIYSKQTRIHVGSFREEFPDIPLTQRATTSSQPGYGILRMHAYREDTALVSCYYGPAYFDLVQRKIVVSSLPTGANNQLLINRVNDYLITPKGIHFTATNEGLFRVDARRNLIKDNLKNKALNSRIEAMEVLPDSSILFATRGRGLIRYQAGVFTTINESAGLASNMIRHLHLAADHSVWVSTFNGVSQVTFHDLKSGGKHSL
ncbi:MAG: hypothetical protein AAFN92_22980, partial [Bacteroidota bacterium]